MTPWLVLGKYRDWQNGSIPVDRVDAAVKMNWHVLSLLFDIPYLEFYKRLYMLHEMCSVIQNALYVRLLLGY